MFSRTPASPATADAANAWAIAAAIAQDSGRIRVRLDPWLIRISLGGCALAVEVSAWPLRNRRW
jgi:hypothetical protein